MIRRMVFLMAVFVFLLSAGDGFAGDVWSSGPFGGGASGGGSVAWADITGKPTISDVEGSTAAGQLLFGDSVGGWDHTENSELYWDDENKRLILGGASSDTSLTIRPSSGGGIKLSESDSSVSAVRILAYDNYGEILVSQTGATKHMIPGIGDVIFNETGGNNSFRIESDTDAEAFFLQGSDGNIGIGTGTPDAKLESLATTGAQFRRTHTDGTKYVEDQANTNGILSVVHAGDALVDDAAYDLPDAAGYGTIVISSSDGTTFEYAQFVWNPDATVTLVANSTNAVAADTDAKLCIFDYDTDGVVEVRNRLGADLKAVFTHHSIIP